MSEPPAQPALDQPPPAVAPRERRRIGRLIVLGVLAVLVVAASGWLFGTEQGRRFLDREQLRQLGVSARGWVDAHPVSFVLMFLAAYVVCAITLMPVWWLQMLAGFAFGLWVGLAWVMAGSTCGALATAVTSRWLGEEWVRERIVSGGRRRRKKPGMMERVMAGVGRNGLLVVLICRLSYPVPYGISNYLFGLTGIKLREIAIGTALGGAPVYAGWVAAGARPEWMRRWEFWAIVIGVNLLILAPLLIRSMRSSSTAGPRPEELSALG